MPRRPMPNAVKSGGCNSRRKALLSDDPRAILEQYPDFDIQVLQQDRGIKIELSHAPAQAFVDGQIIVGINELLVAVVRDIVYVSTQLEQIGVDLGGSAGLTQYVAIALPALVLLALQDRIATAVLGPDWISGAPLGGLTPALLAGYGVFFLLGFVLFSLIYAAMGSFVSRPDDLQTLSLPLSLVAMAGYLIAIVALGGGRGAVVTIASLVPPFSPFVMLARLMVSAVQPWEVLLSIGLLVATIAVVAVVATRMYAAGVLLYGQRPGLRAFVAAARRA